MVSFTPNVIINFEFVSPFPEKTSRTAKIDRRIRDSLSREEVADPRSPAAVEELRQAREPKRSRRDTRPRCPSACHHQDVPSPSPSPLLPPSSHPPTPSALPPH